MPAAKLKVQIYVAQNMEWGFRIIRGSRLILGPEETYKRRAGVRRAVESVIDISYSDRGGIFSGNSKLSLACRECLDAEAVKWKERKTNGYGSKPDARYRR